MLQTMVYAHTEVIALMQRQASNGVGSRSGAWDEPDATTFMVRGSDYMKTKRKVNSEAAIYK